MAFPSPSTKTKNKSLPREQTLERWSDYFFHTWALALLLNVGAYQLIEGLHLEPYLYDALLMQGLSTSLITALCSVLYLSTQYYFGDKKHPEVILLTLALLAGLQLLLCGYHLGLGWVVLERGVVL